MDCVNTELFFAWYLSLVHFKIWAPFVHYTCDTLVGRFQVGWEIFRTRQQVSHRFVGYGHMASPSAWAQRIHVTQYVRWTTHEAVVLGNAPADLHEPVSCRAHHYHALLSARSWIARCLEDFPLTVLGRMVVISADSWDNSRGTCTKQGTITNDIFS
jgi:hypothetical protein